MSKRWTVIGAALAAALVQAPTALAAAPAPGGSTGADARFQVTTTASALQFKTTQEPAFSIVTDDLIDDTLALATNHIDSQGGEAQGASFYPGLLIAQAPQLICQQFFPCGSFTPPQYPLLAEATYPTAREAIAPQAGRLATAAMSADVAQATAHAELDSARAEASVANANAVAGLIRFGSASTSSASRIGPGVITSTVTSSIAGIDIGPLHIGTLTSSDVITVDSHGAIKSVPRTLATGVTLNGLQAAIDSDGVHVLGLSAPSSEHALARAGLSVRLVSASTSNDGGAVRSAAAGLQVSAVLPVSTAPSLPNVPSLNRTYLVTASLAGVGAVVSGDDSLVSLPPIPNLTGVAPIALPTAPVPLPAAVAPTATAVPAGPGPAVAGGTSSVLGIRLDAFNLRTLMLVLLIGSLTLLAGWRALAWVTWRRESSA